MNANAILAEVDSLFTSEDSLSIFNMIDSLIQTSVDQGASQLAIRVAYNSNVGSAGRTLGINKFGLSPGLSYYHKSGLYADASAYWSKEFDPDYYLTVLSAGYLWPVTKRWSLIAEYNRYLYNQRGEDVYAPYKNNLGVSNFIEFKPVTFRLDYSFFFGEKSGHRIMPGMFVSLEKRNWGKVNRFLFYPSFNVMFGSEEIEEEIKLPLRTFYLTKTVFGVMNYSFSVPLSITIKKWNFLLNYTYNIPIALPGEDISLTNSGYASAGITRYISFK